jgi:hypothetical protein
MFKAVMVKLVKEGKGTVKHKEVILPDDLQTYQAFHTFVHLSYLRLWGYPLCDSWFDVEIWGLYIFSSVHQLWAQNPPLITLRFGLQKHFLKSRQEDIINSEHYSAANNMFKAVMVKLVKEGKGTVKHKLTRHFIHSSIFHIYVCEVIPSVILGLTLKFEGYISSPLSINFELKILLLHISQIFPSTVAKVINYWILMSFEKFLIMIKD